MKIVHTELIITAGRFPQSGERVKVRGDIHEAILSIEWPPGSGSFITLHDELGKKLGQGNGVKPFKSAYMKKLESLGWKLETPEDIVTVRRPGPMDATIQINNRLFCVEWETGNISYDKNSLFYGVSIGR